MALTAPASDSFQAVAVFSRSASRRSGSAAQITDDPPHKPRIDSGNAANSAASRYAAGVRFLQRGTRPPGGGPSNASDRAHDLSKLRRSQRGPGHRELVFGNSLSVWGHAPGRTDRSASMVGSIGDSGRARAQLPGAGRRRDVDAGSRGAVEQKDLGQRCRLREVVNGAGSWRLPPALPAREEARLWQGNPGIRRA